MERESIQEVEESLVEGVNFEEPIDWNDDDPLKSWQSLDKGSEQQEQEQQQPIFQPFCSDKVKIPICSSNISLASSGPFDPQVNIILINTLILSVFLFSKCVKIVILKIKNFLKKID